ncbi:hypothetical protein [Roseobacter sp. GAI101]|uniref:hypothetical protein n=1 Tax=Roseobacter sp. (strain GAI101) TaxID=391589 RepID=UPI0001871E0E|nr:hypothetical protein [Roseobacter sp. GAI101]EEB83556.1 conserved hypothetical protein [Roseobacter sp. GAI101]
MRTVAATARRMDRDAQRRHKATVKQQISEEANDAVVSWETYLDELLSIHTNLTDHIDWHQMLAKPQPRQPVLQTKHTDTASQALASFEPKMFDFLSGGSTKKKAALEQELQSAPDKDRAINDQAMKDYDAALSDWENDRSLAKRLVDGDENAIKEVLTEFQTLTDQELIGSSVHFAIRDGVVHAMPSVHSDEVVPNFRRKQLASGKLSQTKMPVGEFNELYQDYVASVALKVAGDMFQMLPLEEVYVTCECEMLNTATGHKEPTPILSVQFVRKTFEQLNLKNIDPSDCMANFNHAMKFSKTKGFAAVQPLVVFECG